MALKDWLLRLMALCISRNMEIASFEPSICMELSELLLGEDLAAPLTALAQLLD
jgi:hypothetical protein